MAKTLAIKILRFIKWLVTLGIVAYVGIFLWTLYAGGAGVDTTILGVHISISDPGKPLLILIALVFLRVCLHFKPANLALLLFSLAVALAGTEIALRGLDLPMAKKATLTQWRQPSQQLGYELIPNISGRGSSRYDVAVNSHGLRDRERPWDKPEGVTRVLCLGDSFTFGMGLDLEQTYVKKLEEQLNSAGTKADVINAGVIGYNLFQSLSWLQQRGLKYQPDWVVYFFFLDDAEGPSTFSELQEYYDDAVSGRIKEFQAKTNGPPESRSYSWNFMQNSYASLSARLRFITADWIRNIEKRKDHFAALNQSFLTGGEKLANFEKNLTDLKYFTSAMGARLLVVLVPDAVQLNNPPMKNTNRVLLDLCSKLEIPFLDITPVFEKQPDVPSLYLFPVDAHTSEKGDALIADQVFQRLKRMGLGEAGQAAPVPAS